MHACIEYFDREVHNEPKVRQRTYEDESWYRNRIDAYSVCHCGGDEVLSLAELNDQVSKGPGLWL